MTTQAPSKEKVLAPLLERLRGDGGRYLLSVAMTREEIDAIEAPTYGSKASKRWLTEEEHCALVAALTLEPCEGWTVEEQADGGWRRHALAQIWQTKADARLQLDDLMHKHRTTTFRLSPASAQPSAPEHREFDAACHGGDLNRKAIYLTVPEDFPIILEAAYKVRLVAYSGATKGGE